jgi:hypothetical protein
MPALVEKIVRIIYFEFIAEMFTALRQRSNILITRTPAVFRSLSKGLSGLCITGWQLMTISHPPWTLTDPNHSAAQKTRMNHAGLPPSPLALNVSVHSFYWLASDCSTIVASSIYPPSLVAAAIKSPSFIQTAFTWLKRQLPNLDPKDLLPIGIEATKGAIVCGNGSTPNLLVAEFSQAEGTFGIVQARSKFDFYKQILSFKFQKALIRYVENTGSQNPMTTTGRIIQEHIEASRFVPNAYLLSRNYIYIYCLSPRYTGPQRLPYLSYRSFTKLWRRLQLYSLTLHKLFRIPGSQFNTPKISRKFYKNLDEETSVGAASATLEYAIERKVLESPVLEVCYYADVVGKVPTEQHGRTARFESFDIGNGDLPPEWGIDVVVHGGFFRYGPWADRQR